MKPMLILPDPNTSGQYSHAQDTFRELGRMWAEHGVVEMVYSTVHVHPFIKMDDIVVCLFDRPLYENWSQGLDCDHVLWGNPAPPGKFQYESTWIFWGRHPRMLEQHAQRTARKFSERPVASMFAGKIENPVQNKNRTQSGVDWSKSIQDFSCPVMGERKYTQQQYLEAIANSRYGLCLPGYGAKCNREIELMALGTVPIVTPGVDIINYYDPPVTGVHYITASTGEELQEKTASITESQWNKMSQACREWYFRNCSVAGSFDTTMKIIHNWRHTS